MIINSVIKGSGGGGQRVIEKFYVVGSCNVDNNYIATGFDDSNYLGSVQPLPGDKTNWEFGTKVHTKSSISGQAYFAIAKNGNIFAVGMYNGGNGSNFGNGSNWYSNYYSLVVVDGTFAADTTYWYKVTYNGTRYSVQRSTDGVNFTEVVYMNCGLTIPEAYLTFGNGGSGSLMESMDLKETYLKVDNVEIWRAVVIS